MTELAVILGVNGTGLIFAWMLGRWLAARDAGSSELRRLGGAVERASQSFLQSEARVVAIVAAALAALLFGLHALLPTVSATAQGDSAFGVETGFWAALAVLLGAATATLSAYMGAAQAWKASLRTVAAARSSLDRALSVALRGGGVAAVVAETTSVLGICALYTLICGMRGAFADGADTAAIAAEAALRLPGFALGAAASGMLLQRGGSIYHAASDIGADIAGEKEAGLAHDDARNPAVVADLVGDHVGPAVGRTVDAFVASTAATVSALLVGAAAQQSNQAHFSPFALIALPLVVRAFGVVASTVGLLVVRTQDDGSPGLALWRGQLSTTAVALGGLGGGCLWLLGEAHWLRFFAAGAVGLIAASAVAHYARLRGDRRNTQLREVTDALRGGDAALISQGLASGLTSALLPVAAIGVALSVGWHLGRDSGLKEGGVIAVTVTLMTLLAAAPYLLALANLGPITDNARGVVSMSKAPGLESALDRAAQLDEAGFTASSVAQTYLILASAAAALFTALAVGGGSSEALLSLKLGKPVVLWSAGLGAALVCAYAGGVVRRSTRGARGVAQEVERQLRSFPRRNDSLDVPADYTPSYKSCIELAGRSALERLLLPVALTLATPLLLGLALRGLFREGDPALAGEALISFALAATITGLTAALVADGTRLALVNVRRTTRPRSKSVGFSASLSGDAFADVVGNAGGPAALALLKAAPVAVLAIAPFVI